MLPGFLLQGTVLDDADGVAGFLVVKDVVRAEAAEVLEGRATPLGLVVVPLLAALVFAPFWNGCNLDTAELAYNVRAYSRILLSRQKLKA